MAMKIKTSNEASTSPRIIPQRGAASGYLGPVAFSSDGRRALTGGGNELIVWDVSTGLEVGRIPAETSAIAVDTDGRVLTGGGDGFIVLWNADTGKEIRRMDGRAAGQVSSVRFSSDGNLAVSAHVSELVIIWNVTTGEAIRHIQHDKDKWVFSAAFSVREGEVLTGGAGGAFLLQFHSGEVLRYLPITVTSLVISSNNTAALIGTDEVVVIWELSTGRVRKLKGHKSTVKSVAFSPNGQLLLSGDGNGTAILWNIADGTIVRTLNPDPPIYLYAWDTITAPVKSLAFSPDGRQVLTAADRSAVLWDTTCGKEIRRLGGMTNYVTCVAFSPDGQRLLIGGWGKTAALWDLNLGREIQRLEGHTSEVYAVAFSPDSQYALTGSHDQTALLWHLPTAKKVGQLRADGGSFYFRSVAFSPDGNKVLTNGPDNDAIIWDLTTGCEIGRLKGHAQVSPVVWSPDGTVVLTGHLDGVAILWDAVSLKEIRRSKFTSRSVDAMTISADNTRALTCSDTSTFLWDIRDGRFLHKLGKPIWEAMGPDELGHNRPIFAVAFSTDGSAALTGSDDGSAILWDLKNGREIQHFQGHSNSIMGVAISPDGTGAVTVGLDGLVIFWDLYQGSQICTMISFEGGSWVAFDTQGRFDTTDLDAPSGLHWIFPGESLRPIPLEVFMRDYFTPRLLARARYRNAREQLPEVRDVSDLNRVQPLVKIRSIESIDTTDLVSVTIEVSGNSHEFQRNGESFKMETGVYDVRLFRDGQLVAQWPEQRDDAVLPTIAKSERMLDRWRDATCVCEPGGLTQETFAVRVPHDRAVKEIEFAAYAFNHDRVKSETARAAYQVPNLPPVVPRAFLLTVGVNKFEKSNWNLNFAAADARLIEKTINPLLKAQGYKISSLRLVSDTTSQPDELAATKANLRLVLNRLAGLPVGEDAPEIIRTLPQPTPDDLVLISFSSHGYTDPSDGVYYFFPTDLGPDFELSRNQSGERFVPTDLLARLVSSEEMSRWLRPIDVGTFVLIVDTCHGAATVDEPGFKPGPMGSRGLGQLAYDKGMRILSASQADDVALEVGKIKQGLLTYALICDGLEDEQAARDGVITIDDWLKYGERRVPTLYEEVLRGEVKSRAVRDIRPIAPAHTVKSAVQSPTLFDFSRKPIKIPLKVVRASIFKEAKTSRRPHESPR